MKNPFTGVAGHVWPLLCLALGVASLSACSASKIPGVYRIDIQQGNVVTQDMLLRLEPGMSKRKVRFVLGTPLIADTFNANRWDYLYTFESGFKNRVQRRISVFFDGDRLTEVRGDVEPAVARTAPEPRRDQIVKVEGPGEQRGLFNKLNPFSGNQKPVAAPKDGDGDGDGDEVSGPTDGQPLDAAGPPASSEPGAPSDEGDAVATSTPATESNASQADEPGLFQRLIGSDAADPAAADAPAAAAPDAEVSPPAPLGAASRTDEVVTAAKDVPEKAAAGAVTGKAATGDAPTAEGGGLFSRIRERFQLPDATGLIDVKPPANEPGGSVGDQ